jgi:hypothetical protein
MTRLNDTALKAELKKAREAQEEIVDSAVPGLAVRVGRGLAATWSLVLRVRGEGGVSRRGFEKKGRRYRLSLGTYPAMSLEAARSHSLMPRTTIGCVPRAVDQRWAWRCSIKLDRTLGRRSTRKARG